MQKNIDPNDPAVQQLQPQQPSGIDQAQKPVQKQQAQKSEPKKDEPKKDKALEVAEMGFKNFVHAVWKELKPKNDWNTSPSGNSDGQIIYTTKSAQANRIQFYVSFDESTRTFHVGFIDLMVLGTFFGKKDEENAFPAQSDANPISGKIYNMTADSVGQTAKSVKVKIEEILGYLKSDLEKLDASVLAVKSAVKKCQP